MKQPEEGEEKVNWLCIIVVICFWPMFKHYPEAETAVVEVVRDVQISLSR
jgi:hypothetical protein